MILFLCVSNVLTLILCAWLVVRIGKLRRAIVGAWYDINSLWGLMDLHIKDCCTDIWPECSECEFIEGRMYDLDRINTRLASSLAPDLGLQKTEDV